jgi:NhaA family Na+:H+ antiporter
MTENKNTPKKSSKFAWKKKESNLVDSILNPFEEFLKTEVLGGVILLFSTVAALLWINIYGEDSYLSFWKSEVVFQIGDNLIRTNLIFIIKKVLMSIFFFMVGLEIKREVLSGELSDLKRASFPIFAAIGGVAFPALIYSAFNYGTEGSSGWGIPMATDIAFAIGILALVRGNVSISLKLFLTALAIVDDIVAVLVIAFFYSSNISFEYLGIAAIIMVILVIFNLLKIKSSLLYISIGVGLWVAFLFSGISTTLAAILLAFTIPAKASFPLEKLVESNIKILKNLRSKIAESNDINIHDSNLQSAVKTLAANAKLTLSPLQKLEGPLHYWVAFFIMPLFALSNAGILIDENTISSITNPVALGIIAGLVLGKPLGIVLFSYATVKLGLAEKSTEMRWGQIIGIGFLAGIGFTMSLYIKSLAFEGFPILEAAGKIGILIASILAGIIGFVVLSFSSRN